jgi:hypothetical protein
MKTLKKLIIAAFIIASVIGYFLLAVKNLNTP